MIKNYVFELNSIVQSSKGKNVSLFTLSKSYWETRATLFQLILPSSGLWKENVVLSSCVSHTKGTYRRWRLWQMYSTFCLHNKEIYSCYNSSHVNKPCWI